MHSLVLVLVLSTAVAATARAQSEPSTSELEQAIDTYLAPLLDLETFSGVVLVADGDSILFEKAYGPADIELGVSLTTGSTFRIASISKSFTRALTGRLWEQGAFGLDDPIAR